MGLPYATKISGFLEELRLEACRLENISAGQLIARIDRAWGMRDELRERIDSALHEIKSRARRKQRSGDALLSNVNELKTLRGRFNLPGTFRRINPRRV
jgi:hypothetical protein